jgi:hypothetical protein
MQEQSTFLQTKSTFGNKSMELVLDNAGSSSYLDLGSAGKMNLLNKWTELHTRMGMKYVSPTVYQQNSSDPNSDKLYFKLTVKSDQRIKYDESYMPRGLKTFVDERGEICVKPGEKLYLVLDNPERGSAGYVFVESSKGGDVTKAMLERPLAPEGVGYVYDPNDGLVDLATDGMVAVVEWVSKSVTSVFEPAPRTRTESITVNGPTDGPRAPQDEQTEQHPTNEIWAGEDNTFPPPPTKGTGIDLPNRNKRTGAAVRGDT